MSVKIRWVIHVHVYPSHSLQTITGYQFLNGWQATCSRDKETTWFVEQQTLHAPNDWGQIHVFILVIAATETTLRSHLNLGELYMYFKSEFWVWLPVYPLMELTITREKNNISIYINVILTKWFEPRSHIITEF